MSWLRAYILAALPVCLCLGGAAALAQADVPAELQNRPPVAAPTNVVNVAPIQVVRSQSEGIDDFAAGLIAGAAALAHVPGMALVVVQNDHIIVQKNFGAADPNVAFDAGSLSDLFLAVTAMQQIEKAKILPDEDISKILGEPAPRGITAAQLLTHQAGNAELLRRLVEKAAGEPAMADIAANILKPFAMTDSGADASGLRVSAADAAHLLIALVNGGAYESNVALQPATVDLMERTHFTVHPALPGWTYGFKEMRRNGWRALQHDGQSPGFQSRVVIVPDAKMAYVAVVQGHADAAFWRIFDDALFDKIFAPHAAEDASLRGVPAPTAADANAAAGLYQSDGSYAATVATLKTQGQRLRVSARGDGALVLSGAENAVLSPREGGDWSSGDGNVVAALRDGALAVDFGNYETLPLWKRAALYFWLALLAGVAGAGAAYYERQKTKRDWLKPTPPVLAAAGTAVALFLVSAAVWLLSSPV